MKRRMKVITILTLSLLLISCGKAQDTNRIMDEAKIAFASKEYEKAEGILKLAMDEGKDKEASGLYSQTKAFREIGDRVSSMKSEDSRGNLSYNNISSNIFFILDKLKIIEESKTESKLVRNELTEYVDKVNIEIIELTNLYKEYIYNGDIKNAEECFKHIEKIDTYKLQCLKENGFKITEYEELLNNAKKDKLNSSNSDGYTREAVYKIAKEKMGLLGASDNMGGEKEPDKNINDEECYFTNIEFSVNGMPRLDQIYIGSKTLKVYSIDGTFRRSLKYDD
ncbi:hypothetical protein [Clostridium algidicarnis]|uniref:hypothetical protein n=1 Tax=Clostridium algidicarnis TaxID=37659 RepID=UPI001C0B3CFD|nr:hypothetical protein [Clostridium algidicarnis]MBU3203523.1 hypothetical protein [Clostridium algidicarnis]MBU3211677.1 hypothetical protein [Clostridium algidicarnis]MBU3221815.1 hypothetical protein [Clostridium algidicarnis]